MNFAGKNSGAAESSNIIINTSGTRRQQQKQYEQEQGGDGGNSFDEDDEEERQKSGQLSYPPLSSHHQHQPPALYHHQVPYHHHAARGGGNWMQGGELSSPPSSRVIEQVTPAPEDDSNQDEGGMMMVVEREHMFDKVVTPSDVGKLNRLVIPKQHAERYFPLDSSSNDKGLLLNFEDRNGKPWRFRYSYWNSSQSYVMTKGWSRFVKDKKLDAGDIVSFQRGVGGSAKDRLFIDWRHRPDAAPGPPYHFSSSSNVPFPLHQFSFSRNNWNPLFLQSQPAAVPSRSQYSNMLLQPSSYRYGGSPNYHNMAAGSIVNVNQSGSGSVIYYRSGPGGGFPQQQHMVGMGGMDPPPLPALPALPLPSPPTPTASSMVFESVPVVHGKSAAGKRLRLFGVNMDCPVSDEENEHDHDHDYDPTIMVSSNALTDPISMGNYHQFPYHHHLHQHQPASSSSTIPYLQLRPYEDEESQFHHTTLVSSSSTDALSKTTKSSSSRMTLDLDI